MKMHADKLRSHHGAVRRTPVSPESCCSLPCAGPLDIRHILRGQKIQPSLGIGLSSIPVSVLSSAPLTVQRLPDQPEGPVAKETQKRKLNYDVAKKQNKAFADKNNLGWEDKLFTVAGGAYQSWTVLWKNAAYDTFADAVAAYQQRLGWVDTDVDGILGLATWSRIAGLGEAIAGIKNVAGDAEFICTSAVDYRIRRAKKLVGEKFELSGDKDWNAYNIILQSIPGRMLDVDEGYRGTGPAGAMVYAGLAEFVSESDIWRGELKPGAAIQVWRHQEAYDLLLVGEKDENGKKRRINDGDANFSGTSFVFVRYDTNANERMWVRHYGSTDPMNKTRYEKWVAANIK